ncbi:Uncharacterised protein [Mycolicibacterium fortuitum]|uniref:Uncharacterized protein n=1 Tax=Mycolicibacterium fortuitum TaxID=1766 RepID=A0A378WDY0_MYCFO|nr:Uncharacterised protein [Mycolicibacterium fortuitum]
MSRRKPTWTPPALPGLRDAQVQAMYRQIDRQRQTLALIEQKLESGQADQIGMPQASAAKNVQKLRDLLPAFEVDAANLAGAQLYWVARKMVQVAVSASPSLPEWTPLAALPAANGLLCWAMSAGQVDGPKAGAGSTQHLGRSTAAASESACIPRTLCPAGRTLRSPHCMTYSSLSQTNRDAKNPTAPTPQSPRSRPWLPRGCSWARSASLRRKR